MIRFLNILAVTLAFGLASASAKALDADQMKADITQFFEDYVANYNAFLKTGDLGAVKKAAQNYLDPFTALGAPVTQLSRDRVEASLTTVLGGFRDNGVTSMRWRRINACPLNDTTALSSNVIVRFKADGSLYDTLSATFVLTLFDESWLISGVAFNDANASIELQCGIVS